MARTISSTARASLESAAGDDFPVMLVTLTHASFSSPVYVCSDLVDYSFGGHTFKGVALKVELISDDDQPPRAQLSIANVDRLVSSSLLPLDTAPAVTIQVVSSADFSTSGSPRTPIGSPAVLYTASGLKLANVSGDAVTVSADLTTLLDASSEPFPGITGTQARLPGLFR